MSQQGYIASKQAQLKERAGFDLYSDLRLRRTPLQVQRDNARLIVGIFQKEEAVPKGFRVKTGATPVNWREESMRRRFG